MLQHGGVGLAASACGASRSNKGVPGPIPGVIGALASAEAVEVLLYTPDGSGFGNPLSDRLLMYDAAECTFATMNRPKRRGGCLACDAAMAIRPGIAQEADLK